MRSLDENVQIYIFVFCVIYTSLGNQDLYSRGVDEAASQPSSRASSMHVAIYKCLDP